MAMVNINAVISISGTIKYFHCQIYLFIFPMIPRLAGNHVRFILGSVAQTAEALVRIYVHLSLRKSLRVLY